MRSVARQMVPRSRRVPRIHLLARSLASKKPRAQHSVILDFDYRIVFENDSNLMCCKQIIRVGATRVSVLRIIIGRARQPTLLRSSRLRASGGYLGYLGPSRYKGHAAERGGEKVSATTAQSYKEFNKIS